MRVALTLVLSLLPLTAWGGDSDCFSRYASGNWQVTECFLCDGDHSSTDCAEFDLDAEGDGIPEYLVAEISKTTGCSGTPSIDVRGLDRQLGAPAIYDTLTPTGTSAVVVNPARHRHLDADVDITTSAGCTDLEVTLRLFRRRLKP